MHPWHFRLFLVSSIQIGCSMRVVYTECMNLCWTCSYLIFQMLDLVKPRETDKVTLRDLKTCKLAYIFFDTFFNLEKYLEHEQRDPFTNTRVSVYFSINPNLPDPTNFVSFGIWILIFDINLVNIHEYNLHMVIINVTCSLLPKIQSSGTYRVDFLMALV